MPKKFFTKQNAETVAYLLNHTPQGSVVSKEEISRNWKLHGDGFLNLPRYIAFLFDLVHDPDLYVEDAEDEDEEIDDHPLVVGYEDAFPTESGEIFFERFSMYDQSYIPDSPHDRQKVFLDLDCKEALFGGAAGGGKSEALLMAALQYVHVPNYSALLLRKTFADLSLPGALMDRAHQWLGRTNAKWNGVKHEWSFPSGAKLAFGYIAHPLHKYRYQSSEFQFIGFDELTQFNEDEYMFLFSRLRRTKDLDVPLRVRSATNPIGAGMLWVKKRFIPDEYMSAEQGARFARTWSVGERAFVPSRVADNPHLDRDEYVQQLSNLDPETRSRLLDGSWEPAIGGKFKRQWFRYYTMAGDYINCSDGQSVNGNTLLTVSIVDPAGTSRDVADEKKSNPKHSWSVISTWKLAQDRLILWDVVRGKWETPELLEQIRLASIGSAWVGIEADGLGRPIASMAAIRCNVKPLRTQGKDKITRAVPYLNMVEQGKVWFPERADWLEDWEAEHILWTGLARETSDQIDTAAYAATAWADYQRLSVVGEPPIAVGAKF